MEEEGEEEGREEGGTGGEEDDDEVEVVEKAEDAAAAAGSVCKEEEGLEGEEKTAAARPEPVFANLLARPVTVVCMRVRERAWVRECVGARL